MKHIIKSKVEKLDGMKINIPDSPSSTAYNTTEYHSENHQDGEIMDNFFDVKFEMKDGRKIQKRMFQPNPLETIQNDVKKTEAGNIRGTELKGEISKMLLDKDKEYNLNVNGAEEKGKYLGPNPHKNRQLRFDVNGKTINTDKNDIQIEIENNIFNI